MSPEAIIDPESLDARSDLYSLGAVAYYLLTGTHVFSAKSVVEICGRHLYDTPQSLTQRLGAPVPEDLEALVLDCLAKSRDARPRDASEMLARLERCASRGTWQAAHAREWWQRWESQLRPAATTQRSGPVSKTDLQVDFAARR
jgi:serine/threonine-protein kinase